MQTWRTACEALAVHLVVFALLLPPNGYAACGGDCNASRQVTVDELLTGVNIALGNISVSDCFAMDSNLDRLVTIDELLSAVNGALNGCGTPASERLTALYNGYFLTVDPARAVAAGSTADRYRLYVLHGVLIDPNTGRVAAIFPALGTPAFAGGPVAHTASTYAALQSAETPPAPGTTADQLRTYWRKAGVSEVLLAGATWVDLAGGVATAGLTDTHFHVSPWSKKLPASGERFGYYADVSDPAYYVNPSDWSLNCPRDALWRMVADANRHLAETGDDGIYLHGYLYTEVDNDATGQLQPAYMYASAATCEGASFNPRYLINRVSSQAVTPPANVCSSDPATWPALPDPALPALLVQTTGQSCWYNSALLAGYNQREEARRSSIAPIPLEAVLPSGLPDGATWTLRVPAGTQGSDPLFNATTPYQADVVVAKAGESGTLTVPFDIVSTDASQLVLTGQAMIPELATSAFSGTLASLDVRPFYRPIVTCIPKSTWDAAAAYWGQLPGNETVGYGAWDPRNPYATNWYNGAKRGLIQYFYDAAAQAFRPTGYAEHYPMRDALGTVVLAPATIADNMEQRRRVAAWCHRHGLTLTNDIMFYRRPGQEMDFLTYEALSYDHQATGDLGFYTRVGLDPAVSTGNFNLRVGCYYYVETADDVGPSLSIAHDAAAGSDVNRLKPAPDNPEYPGWVRWLGWKLQLDGAASTRSFFSNAPVGKLRLTDPLTVANQSGNQVTFRDHSYGLLTMTDIQEQVFTSRESAALYWLVRESDPGSAFHNPALPRDWSALAKGVVGFLGVSISSQALATDLQKLNHVTLTSSQAAQMAAKIVTLVEQVNDAFDRTLAALIRIWYARAQSPAALPEMPSQTACHTAGDGAVDLWAHAIAQLKRDVESLPSSWADLPPRWQAVIPASADLSTLRRTFTAERFRIEHLLNISRQLLDEVSGPGGLDAATTPAGRNIVVSSQPSIFVVDGHTMASTSGGFPVAQELWPILSTADTWGGLPALPRYQHLDPLTTYLRHDIPLTINTDPPAMRDPRPALTVLGAVARTPIEIDPTHWADQTGAEPEARPPDYLVGKVYTPFAYLNDSGDNPLQLTIEEALASMTFWGAYSANMDTEAGAIAVPTAAGQPGWFADLVVWRANPLAISGPNGLTLDALGRMGEGPDDAARLATVNAFITKFLPSVTVVGGIPVYRSK